MKYESMSVSIFPVFTRDKKILIWRLSVRDRIFVNDAP